MPTPDSSARVKALEAEVAALRAEKQSQQEEMEELLSVLAEQTSEIRSYKAQLGLPIESDEDTAADLT